MLEYNERDYDFNKVIPSEIATSDEAARLMFELDGAISNLQRQVDIAKHDAVTKRKYLKGHSWPDLVHSLKEAKRIRAAVQERKGQIVRQQPPRPSSYPGNLLQRVERLEKIVAHFFPDKSNDV